MTNVLYMPDGNRRFALDRNIPLSEAYDLGGKTLRLLSQFFLAEERAEMLIYHALSNYTQQRTDSSLDSIFEAATKTFEDLAQENFFKRNEIDFRVIDHSKKLPATLERATKVLCSSTAGLDKKECVVLLGYSLKDDINQALSLKPIDYESFREGLIFPEIDLVLRPLEMRVSSGPVYAMSQAQMITLGKLNPEVSREDLESAWQEYLALKDLKIKGNPSYHK